MVINITGENVSNTEAPIKTFIPAGAKNFEIGATERVDQSSAFSYNYKYNFTWGNNKAKHDDSVRYQIPHKSDLKVLQGFHGTFSHKGQLAYSIDWASPINTPVHASRDGLVHKVKSDSNEGGGNSSFKDKANMVSIV